jgi:hypothetical protein
METNKKKSRATAGATFGNRDQVLGGGCNWGIADMRIYHNFWEEFKSGDMLEISAININKKAGCFRSCLLGFQLRSGMKWLLFIRT